MQEETVLQSKIHPHQAGKSLLDFLCDRFRYQTRETWEDLITRGKVTLNGETTPSHAQLQKGDLVSYHVVLNEPPVDKNIQILHEEESFLMASKPGQLPSHADGNYIKNTFIFLITETLRAKGWKGEVRLVHRLDRETSGLMVVAKNKDAHLKLTRQFEQGLVSKEYLAIVRGQVGAETFEVQGAIGKDDSSSISIRQKVVPEGTPFSKVSVTKFEKLQDLRNGSLLRCLPQTGRTNQIRVHLTHAGHPLIGDKLYGRTDEEFLEFIHYVKAGGDPSFKERMEVPRHFLHAARLSFDHPVTGKKISFEAPLPPDMKEFLVKTTLRM